MRSPAKCIAREPLVHGSQSCGADVGEHHVSDLCEKHRALISPHQIVNGVFYVGRDEDE